MIKDRHMHCTHNSSTQTGMISCIALISSSKDKSTVEKENLMEEIKREKRSFQTSLQRPMKCDVVGKEISKEHICRPFNVYTEKHVLSQALQSLQGYRVKNQSPGGGDGA